MTHQIHPQLLDLAQWRLDGEPGSEKAAFAPPPMDPAAAGGMPPGGAPPADPAMAGAGGAPPMDPAAGGAPPMDPSMGAPPDLQGMITQAVQAAMQGVAGGAPGAGPAGGKPKIDPTFIYMEQSRTRKLLTGLYQHLGIELPPDILDDGSVAQLMAGAQPDSPPIGQEGGQTPEAGPAGLPGIGASAPISPIEPPKQAADVIFEGRKGTVGTPVTTKTFEDMNRNLDALAAMSRSLNAGSG